MSVYHSFDEVIARVTDAGRTFRVAVVAAGDAHTMEAVSIGMEKGILSPILLGDRAKIEEEIGKLGLSIPAEDIVDIPDPEEDAAKAVELIKAGDAEFIMKGKLDTSKLLAAVVNKETGLGTGSLMSSFKFLEVPSYHKLLSVLDGGLVTYPTLEQKKGILENAVRELKKFGYEKPKIGVLACIEKVNPKMPETVEANELKEMNQRGEIRDCIIEGPISYDCAMSKEVADIKGYESPICGDPDVLLAPNIHAANIMGKMLVLNAGAKTAGYIAGASCPIVMSSRGSSAEEKFFSLALAAAAVIAKNE